jgi:hypothetical protein
VVEAWVLVSSEVRVSFVLSCCSTEANWTSCWVNWLVSSGSSGLWFWSCVVSRLRNWVKLPAMAVRSGVVADAAGGARYGGHGAVRFV